MPSNAADGEGGCLETSPSQTAAIHDQLHDLEISLLVARAQVGDISAFRLLMEKCDRRLAYFVMRLVDDPEAALDVLQETWLTVYQGIHKLQAPEAFRTWVYRIARGKCIDELRRHNRVPTPSSGEMHEVTVDDAMLSAVTDIDLVHRTLEGLSAAHREVLALHFLESMSIEEIAQVTGDPIGTIKSRMFHAKMNFRRIAGEAEHT